jgi:hypothetical protein
MKELDIFKVLKKRKRVEKEKKLKIAKMPLLTEDEKFKKKSKLKKIYLENTLSSEPRQSSSENISIGVYKTNLKKEKIKSSVGLTNSNRDKAITTNSSSAKSSSSSNHSYSTGSFSSSSYQSFSMSNNSAYSFKKETNISNFINQNNSTKKEVNVVVKTNFTMAGRKQADGSRATKEAVGSHASASLNYIENHGNRDLEEDAELSNLYDETGDRVFKDDFYGLRNSLEKDDEISAFRRVVISPKEDLTREEMKDLTLKTFQEFQEQTNKDLSFKFAIHTDTENIHAHVVIIGANADINFSKEQLGMFKDIAHNVTKEIEQERDLEKSISSQLSVSKETSKDIEQEI